MKLVKPMLAKPYDKIRDFKPFGWIASGKIDGFRATVQVNPDTGKPCVYTRSLKPHANKHVQHLFAREELVGFDGELVVGDDFHSCSSLLRRVEGKPAVIFWVFDFIEENLCINRLERLEAAAHGLTEQSKSRVKVLPQFTVTSNLTAEEIADHFVSEGFEGVVFRHPDGLYKEGPNRSNDLVKVKEFVHAKAKVIGFEHLQHNHNQPKANELGQMKRSTHKENIEVDETQVGALICVADGFSEQFNIGTQTNKNRREWLDDKTRPKVIEFKYQKHGSTTIRPRIPILVRKIK